MDDQASRAQYAAELGDEWTEVEPGIYVRVDAGRSLQAFETVEASRDLRLTKEAG